MDTQYPTDDLPVDDQMTENQATDDLFNADDDASIGYGRVDDAFAGEHSETQAPAGTATTTVPASTGTPLPMTTTTTTTPPQTQVPLNPSPLVLSNAQSPEELMMWGTYTWENLPNEIQKAFEILGYDEELWNTEGTALATTLHWRELTPPQQEQAGILGYTPELWNTAQSRDYNMITGMPLESKKVVSVPTDARPLAPMTIPTVNIPVNSPDHAKFVDSIDEEIEAESNVWLLFFASSCMLLVGVLNWLRERQVYHIWMVQGGVFGILGAITLEFSDFAALLLQTVSTHCFLIQAFFMIKLRQSIRPVTGMKGVFFALWGADVLFAIGALMQVILTYCLHADGDAYYSVGLAKGEVMAAWFWFFTGVVYTINTMILVNQSLGFDDGASVGSRTLTITRTHPNGESYTIRPAAIQLRNKDMSDAVIT